MATNDELFARARTVIPGGVNSPVRAFGAVGGTPYFVERAEGPYVWDVEGRRLVDLVQSYGAIIAGHAHPAVVEAVQRAARDGTSYGAPTEREVRLAEAICARMPSCEKVRLTSSGTEATMSAIRVARGFTGRPTVVKFAGNYHGHGDLLLAEAGSGVATLGLPGSAGVTDGAVADTAVVPYNVVPALDERTACVVVEPIAANMGLVPPRAGFLEGLRAECDRVGALLVFDEVITGFRVAPGGAQALYDVTPDLTAMGKVIGGGLNVGAFGGRVDVMDVVAPVGPVYHAGTLSGNPLATAAGLAVLELLDDAAYASLRQRAKTLAGQLQAALDGAGIVGRAPVASTLVGLHLGGSAPQDYDGARATDEKRYAALFHALLDRGVAIAPGAYEVLFPGLAHTDEVLAEIAAAATDAAHAAARRHQVNPSGPGRSTRKDDVTMTDSEAAGGETVIRFPEGFLWGVATAAHQIEGGNWNNDWWVWEHLPDSPCVEPSGDGCDSWNRWAEDVALVGELGLGTYRFSLEWSRIEPEEGDWSPAAMAHYRAMGRALVDRGIEPTVTFHHFTTPRWVADRGGWENPETADRFARFCERAAGGLGDVLGRACTLNEPNIVALNGWRLGLFPPGKQDGRLRHRVNAVFVEAHRKAVEAIRAAAPGVPVGLTLAMNEWQATDDDEATLDWLDHLRTAMEDVYLDAVQGDDFLGVQTYTRLRISREGLASPEPGVPVIPTMGYEYWPDALQATLRRAWDRTGGAVPLLVTENGIATEDDQQRIAYVRTALQGVARCLADGIDVRGYLYWSLLDNFEWALGYGPRFGLVAVDRTSFVRRVKDSGTWFADVAATNSLVG